MNRTIHTLEETLIKSLVYLTEAYDCFYQTQRIENILTESMDNISGKEKDAAKKIEYCYSKVPKLIRECSDYIMKAQMACIHSIETELSRK